MNDLADRLNQLTAESTQTWLDAAHLVQRQNVQALEAWLGALESNRQHTVDLTAQLYKQGQEAQQLWIQLASQSFRTTVDTFTRTAASQMRGVSEQVANGARQAEAAATQ